MNAKSRTAAALLAAILTACTTPSAPTPAAGQSTGQAQPHNLIVFFTPDADPNAVSAWPPACWSAHGRCGSWRFCGATTFRRNSDKKKAA